MSKTIQSILLVDDDTDDQLLFREALAEADGSVHCYTAKNGIDALNLLNDPETDFPDLIVMDVNMPIMNGLECLAELKKSDKLKSIPVILYSTCFTQNSREECISSGAVDCMEKPSDYLLLCSYIKNILTQGVSAPVNKLITV